MKRLANSLLNLPVWPVTALAQNRGDRGAAFGRTRDGPAQPLAAGQGRARPPAG